MTFFRPLGFYWALLKTVLFSLFLQCNLFVPNHLINLISQVNSQSLNVSELSEYSVDSIITYGATNEHNGEAIVGRKESVNLRRVNVPRVKLPQGVFEGYTEWVNGTEVNVFKGIPYADPPIGDQRFLPARLVGLTSNRTYSATEFGPNCWEPSLGPVDDIKRSGRFLIRSEDCLHLNIWSPFDDGLIGGGKLRPVIVYVHGGMLIMYSANDSKWTDGRSLAAMGNVVVVTVNYRLGTLGFLFSGDSNAPGNLGLTDQVTALVWIKRHIQFFGGDPNRITLYGLSSGALSTSTNFLSGSLNGLISGLVLDSGGPSPIWIDSREQSLARFRLFASKAGCYSSEIISDTSRIVSCLRTKPALQLTLLGLDPENQKITGPGRGEAFFPTLESDLLPQKSINQLFSDHLWAPNIPILFWTVTDEGYAPALYGNFPKLRNPTVAGCSQHLMATRYTLLPSFNNGSSTLIADLIKTYCKGYEGAPGAPLLLNFNSFLGDWLINCPVQYFADILAKDERNPVYYGLFTYYNVNKILSPDFNGAVYGTRHGMDKIFMMGIPYTYPDDYSDADRDQSNQLMKIYSQFAYSGDPGWTSYQITSNGRIVPYIREVNRLKDIEITSINDNRIKCYVWNDIFYRKL